jgi:hypothetical protein
MSTTPPHKNTQQPSKHDVLNAVLRLQNFINLCQSSPDVAVDLAKKRGDDLKSSLELIELVLLRSDQGPKDSSP